MTKMKIVVPVYNAQDWIRDCLDSISSQQHRDFECIVINDLSKDKTGDVIEGLKLDSRFKIQHNEKNQGALYNIVNGFKSLDTKTEPESVLMAIDGDDKLASSTSLSVVDKVYRKIPDCLLTYGSYSDWPSGQSGICEVFPAEVIKNRSFRSYPKFITSHLRTFKSKLWHQLTDEDLIDPRTNKHYSVAWDLSFMMPMLEIAGDKFIYIPQTLYFYNRVNPISDGYVRQKEQWETDQFIRSLPKKREGFLSQIKNEDNKRNPFELLSHYRFDIVLKYLYSNSIVKSYKTDFFREMYMQHLKLWNGFKEYNNPKKNTFEAFDNEFKSIIKSISDNGFDSNISLIPVEANKFILNGAHRVAACMALNKPIEITEGINFVAGQKDCSWQTTFQPIGLAEKYANRTALEYAKLKKNSYIVTLFPTVKGNYKPVLDILNQYGKVFYYRGVDLNKNGPLNLMREFYAGEPWAGGPHNNFQGFREKERLCYTSNNQTLFFLVEFEKYEDTVVTKKAIRDIFKVGNHSVHINDTHEQTIRLAQIAFNDNSIQHLNNSKPIIYQKFESCIKEYREFIKENNLDIDDYAITASSVLSVYGLREGDDLDYIHRTNTLIKDSKNLIHSHNQYLQTLYGEEADELLLNPDNHFYSKGVKFISLEIIKKLKQKRNESKDVIDINLINSIF